MIIDKDAYLKLRENNLDDQAKLKKEWKEKRNYIFSVNQKKHIDE